MLNLSNIFSSKTRINLLAFLLAHATERFYINSLAKKLKTSASSLQRSLSSFEKIGILTSSREANVRYYTVNEKCPIYPELKNLILKTVGLGDVLRENLTKLADIQYVFIFGSFAQGDEGASSDIDLMIIGRPDEEVLLDIIREVETNLLRDINYTIFSFEEWKSKREIGNSFVRHILANKIIPLIGDIDELR